jgi:anti-sigma regulatory factor (Ser/Thr protein kinase)
MSTELNARPRVARVEVAAMPTAPGLARSFVRHALGVWGLGGLADSAELVASELVTNAVKATGKPVPQGSYVDVWDLAVIAVELRVNGRGLRVAVEDSSREQPVPQTVDADAEGGRGLFLVATLSTRWGVLPLQGGKVTWAELALGGREVATAEGLPVGKP